MQTKTRTLVSIIFLLISCHSRKNQNAAPSSDWNKKYLETLEKRHLDYVKNYSTKCSNTNRDLEFDLIRKRRILETFNFENHFELFLIENKQSLFDSIIAINIFEHQVHEVEFPTYFTDFIVFKNNEVISQYEVEEYLDETQINKSETSLKVYNTKYNQKDGCSFGLKILTTITKADRIDKVKIFLNPEDNLNFK